MKKTIFLTFVAVLVLASALPSTAYAGNGTGDCVKGIKALIDSSVPIFGLDSPNDTDDNHGDAISDGFFGNEPNLLNTDTDDDLGPNEVEPGSSAGYVDPSLSPGPGTVSGGWLTWGTAFHGVVRDNCAQ